MSRKVSWREQAITLIDPSRVAPGRSMSKIWILQQLERGAAPFDVDVLKDEPDEAHDEKNLRERPRPSYQDDRSTVCHL